MVLSNWRKLSSNWSVVFTVGVALYLMISAMDFRGHLPFAGTSSSGNSQEESVFTEDVVSSSTSTISAAKASWSAEVVSLKIEPDKKDIGNFNALVSLEIKNNSKQNVKIDPAELRLATTGSSPRPPKSNTSLVTISPQLPVIVPVTFSVNPRSGANYELTYQGRTIYSGKPV